MKKQTTVIIILATALIAYFLCSCQQKREVEESLQEEKNIETVEKKLQEDAKFDKEYIKDFEDIFTYLQRVLDTNKDTISMELPINMTFRAGLATKYILSATNEKTKKTITYQYCNDTEKLVVITYTWLIGENEIEMTSRSGGYLRISTDYFKHDKRPFIMQYIEDFGIRNRKTIKNK